MKKIVILISGRGSNMQAILAARLPVTVAAVISNEPRAAGLAFAHGQRADHHAPASGQLQRDGEGERHQQATV